MRTFLTAAALAAGALILSACGLTAVPIPPVAAPSSSSPAYVPATPVAPMTDSTDAAFLADVQPRLSVYAWAGGTNSGNLIAVAHSTCQALDARVPAGAVINGGQQAGMSQPDVLAIIGAAVRIECPRHTPDLIAWVATQ